ncbi:hypothetical protein E4U10_003753 [Claviceps purpurea]|nr:hypothetical protein E4U10_003753 [Claviceps purpurea]
MALIGSCYGVDGPRGMDIMRSRHCTMRVVLAEAERTSKNYLQVTIVIRRQSCRGGNTAFLCHNPHPNFWLAITDQGSWIARTRDRLGNCPPSWLRVATLAFAANCNQQADKRHGKVEGQGTLG